MVFEWQVDGDLITEGKHTALVQLEGVIDAKSEASAENITGALQSAFKDKNTQGVILRINSPGGSPVQSGIINDEVRRLRGVYPDTPLYVVVEDVCASGGYFVAAAADKIYVNKASLVGSIGVLMDGFGFTGGMEKLGVERRLLTAGDNKGFMDPFSPVDPKQKEYALGMLNDIHQQFIAVVKQGRGKRLKDDPALYSGLVWTGQKAVELGLADGYGSVESVARDVIKAESIVDYTQKVNPLERIAKRVGVAAAKSFAEFTLRENLRMR
jgi:protease-4